MLRAKTLENPTTLSRVLRSADDLPWNEAIYLPEDKNWDLDSPAVVWDPNDCEGDEDPVIARINGLAYVFGVSTIQDIVINARSQKVDCTSEDLLNAFLFYHKNDAFVIF